MRAIIRLLPIVGLLATLAAPALAGATQETGFDYFDPIPHASEKVIKDHYAFDLGLQVWAGVQGLPVGSKTDARLPAIQVATRPIMLKVSNDGFGTQPGEPNPKKAMKRTLWRHFSVAKPSRIVVHTFGSEVDTAIAVYTGSGLRKLKQVAFNDDTALPGGPATGSLVAFDAKPGTIYHVQVGSKTGAAGDVRLDTFFLPKTGGLTAFLLDGLPLGTFPGTDWVCFMGSGGTGSCPSPRFVVHNASASPVEVTGSSGFGPGLTAPAPFALAPGATTLQTFAFETSFDVATARSVSSAFVFQARAGAKLVGTTRTPGVVSVAAADTSGVALSVRTVPLVQTAWTGQLVAVPMAVTNTGTAVATGCAVVSSLSNFPPFNVVWYRLAASGKTLEPALNPVFDVAPGATVRLVAGFVSGTPRIADDSQTSAVRVDCSNASRFDEQLAETYAFDVTTMDSLNARLHPLPKLKGNVLAVKKTGTVLKLTVLNDGGDATLTLAPSLLAPSGDPAAARYKVAACPPTASDAACLKSKATSVSFDVKAGKSFTVKVAVKAPAKDPGFDPDLRRLLVTLTETHDLYGPIVAGSVSVGLKKR